MPDEKMAPETIAAQAGGDIDAGTGAIVPPIHVATTFERDGDLSYPRGLVYGRADNATVRQVEAVITALENGNSTLLFASGMAAATSLFLGLVRPAHIVAPHVMYWGLRKWLIEDAPGCGLEVSFVDGGDTDAVAAAIRPGETRLVWTETPANPLWTITDIAALAERASAAGALLAVDSTAATPVLTNPLRLGADVVMHSATKYLNGHSDVLAGSLTFGSGDTVTGPGGLAERTAHVRGQFGAILGPFEAALLLRGLRTLYVRVSRQCESAATIAAHFSSHPRIAAVLYPGLADFPDHELAARQMTGGFGGMLSLRVARGEAAAVAAASRLRLWKRATSLGGIESLVEHRASIEGPGSPCPPDLLRLSVGLEDVGDLIGDLEQALE